MSVRRKRQFAAVALSAGLLLIVELLRPNTQPPMASPVTISFLGFTNFPGNNLRYARFSVSNQAEFEVRFHGFLSEIEGNQNGLAPIIDPRMPECHFVKILKGRTAITNAVGQPPDQPSPASWRFNMLFSRYTMSERWLDFIWVHPWLQRFGATRLIDPQRIRNPTNFTRACSPWLGR